MPNRLYLFFLIIFFIVSCKSGSDGPPQGWQWINVGPFKIATPPNWSFEDPGKQGDSFIGEITGPNVKLSFDCSDMGYANRLSDDSAKNYNIKIDTTDKYIIKTLWPKVSEKGMTGVYIHSRSSSFNFQMNGKNLSSENEHLALKAFKTIIFK
jgi:hypothetical protein